VLSENQKKLNKIGSDKRKKCLLFLKINASKIEKFSNDMRLVATSMVSSAAKEKIKSRVAHASEKLENIKNFHLPVIGSLFPSLIAIFVYESVYP